MSERKYLFLYSDVYVVNYRSTLVFFPGQWGIPTVSVAGVFGMLAGVLASIIDSVGDYYACARISGAQPPPKHAINRGIRIEGVGCLFAGAFGSGSGTATYSQNIGAIGITKVSNSNILLVVDQTKEIIIYHSRRCHLMVLLGHPIAQLGIG